jgi:toxin ParE1/3/4
VKYRFSTEARADVREAKAFLGKDSKKKRNDFADAVEHAVQSLLEYPERGSPYELNTRRIMLEGFPYAMIYYLGDGGIHIIAVWHHSRDPKEWRGRVVPRE